MKEERSVSLPQFSGRVKVPSSSHPKALR